MPSPPLVPALPIPPDNVFDSGGNVKLPVDIEWNNVEAIVSVDACPVETYRYEVDDTPGFGSPEVSDVAPKVGGVPVLHASILFACSLDSGETYDWRVRACSDAAETDCTAYGNVDHLGASVDFTTSLAPGLNSPLDADWEGPFFATSTVPIVLDWCPSATAVSYLLKIYEPDAMFNPTIVTLAQSFPDTITEYDDEPLFRILNRDTFYWWEVGYCTDLFGVTCPIFSQRWTLIPEGVYDITTLTNPPDGGAVNLTHNLNWESLSYVFTYVIRIKNAVTGVVAVDWFSRDEQIEVKWLWVFTDPDTEYTWQVAPCFQDNAIGTCQIPEEGNPDKWSTLWTFWTTGAQPTSLTVSPISGGRAAIPFTLDWDDMPGAASYDFEVATDMGFGTIVTEGVVVADDTIPEGSQIFVPFQGLFDIFKQDTTYYWRVRTCADSNGPNASYTADACGDWTATQSFTTVDLAPPPPIAPFPPAVGFIPDFALEWDGVFSGNFYRYQVDYILKPAAETSSACTLGLIAQGTTSDTSATIQAQCIGTYEAQVQACLDANCTEIGAPSIWTFDVEEQPIKESGLVPCGRVKNDPNTPWDERQPCGFQHLLLLLRNLIDFAIFRLSIIIIAVMLLLTGAVSYLSLGAPNTLAQIKSTWKAVIAGVLILLLAWLFLNLLLGFFGFNVGIFGNWYEPLI